MNANKESKMKTETAASKAYLAHQKEIAKMIETLQAKLESHARVQQMDLKSWAFPGDLGHVRGKLDEIINFLDGAN